jgi:NCS1 family nucleobase:cation symporter-1
MIGITGTLFAYFSILIMNFGDYSRYVKSSQELLKGNLSLIVSTVIYSFLLLVIVIGADIFFKSSLISTQNLLTNPTDIVGKINNTYITVTVLIFIFFASSSTNLIANYFPSQNILINLLPNSLSLKSSGFLIILFGFLIGIFWTPFFSQNGSMSIIDTLSAFFGPIFGVMIFDYYVVKNKVVINKDLFSARRDSAYLYSAGWHIKAYYSFIIGFIFSSASIWNSKFMFLDTFSFIIGFIIAGITYYLLASD